MHSIPELHVTYIDEALKFIVKTHLQTMDLDHFTKLDQNMLNRTGLFGTILLFSFYYCNHLACRKKPGIFAHENDIQATNLELCLYSGSDQNS